MRHKKMGFGLALLVLLLSTVLGATVLREPIARAATPFTNVIVGNTTTNPVPVVQQGTEDVSTPPVTDGGGAVADVADSNSNQLATPVIASALMVFFSRGGGGIMEFSYQGHEVLRVPNEAGFNDSDPGVTVNVPLTRAVKFDEIRCFIPDFAITPGSCAAFFAGATP